jgi:hypothetical protein
MSVKIEFVLVRNDFVSIFRSRREVDKQLKKHQLIRELHVSVTAIHLLIIKGLGREILLGP